MKAHPWPSGRGGCNDGQNVGSGRDFAVRDSGQVFLVGPARVTGLIAKAPGCFADPWGFQRAGQILDLFVDLAAVLGGHEASYPSYGNSGPPTNQNPSSVSTSTEIGPMPLVSSCMALLDHLARS